MATKTVVVLVAASVLGFGAGWLARPDSTPAPPQTTADDGDGTLLAGASAPALAVSPEKPKEAPAAATNPTPKPATPPAKPTLDHGAWLARFNAVKDQGSLQEACKDLFRIRWSDGYQMALAIYERVNNTMSRNALLDIYTHPARAYLKDVVKLLALAMRDPDTKISVRAHQIAGAYVLENLADAPDRATYWQHRFEEATLGEVAQEALHSWLARAQRVEAKDVEEFLAVHNGLGIGVGKRAGLDLAAEARDAGALTLFERWWRDPALSPRARSHALELVRRLDVDDAYLREQVLPLIEAGSAAPVDVQLKAVEVLADPKRLWALAPVLRLFERPALRDHWSNLSYNVSRFRSRRAIPTLIAALEGDTTKRSVRDLGRHALADLTGVRFDPSHDGAWWRAWWERARTGFAPEVASLEIPHLNVPELPEDDEEDSDAGDE